MNLVVSIQKYYRKEIEQMLDSVDAAVWRGYVSGVRLNFFTGAELDTADLLVDAVYSGYKTEKGGVVDPLTKLVGVSRQGGFRYRGTRERPTLLVLTSNLSE